MHKVIIIGGGASGLLAAYSAASLGKKVVIIEKNEKLGKKIYITGKGRCNLTNDVDVPEFMNNVVTNSKFIYSSINALTPEDTKSLFENLGLSLKTERGNRVFPLSDKASDVTKVLEKTLSKLGVEICLNTVVNDLIVENQTIKGVKTDKGDIFAESVIICTGGVSYPLTGSTGDGYNFAKKFGHLVLPTLPALVGIELLGDDYKKLQGLSLKNVRVKCFNGDKQIYTDFGEMLFTHFGVSGPIILSTSSIINKFDFSKLKLVIDLKPALDEIVLDSRLVKELKVNNLKSLQSCLRSLLPKALVELVALKSQISVNKKCSEVTLEERKRIISTLKNLTFKIKKLRHIDEAIITSGGVCVKEINPKTMESKLVSGLYFAGEVIDVDAFTGGFNLQIAFSTGYVAGLNA